MILFFDTETTGFWNHKLPHEDPKQCRVVQLGALLVDDKQPHRPELMRLDTIIYQPYPIPEQASKVHGISTELCQGIGVNESAIMDVFFDMVDVADMVVAHNIKFDKQVLIGTAQRLRNANRAPGEIDAAPYNPFAGKPEFCTMMNLVDICKIPNKNGFKGFAWPKLEEAVRQLLGREPTAAHNAIGDVIDCKDLFFHIIDLREGVPAVEVTESSLPESDSAMPSSHEMRRDFLADTRGA